MMARANTMLYGMNGHAYYLIRNSADEVPDELELPEAAEKEGGQLILL